jgi:hypothetical protein
MTIRNVARYLATIVEKYRDDCAAGFPDEWEAKGALWKAAVIVCDVADEPDPWIDELCIIALDVLKASRIETTIHSARRRAGRR